MLPEVLRNSSFGAEQHEQTLRLAIKLSLMTTIKTTAPTPNESDAFENAPNTVALIGFVLTGIAATACIVLFYMADQLPASIEEFRQMETGTSTQLRLLILGCSTGLLAFVGFVLCVIGLLLPRRTRVLATVGTCLSGFILLGVFGTLLIGTWLNPVTEEPVPVEQSTDEVTSAIPLSPEAETDVIVRLNETSPPVSE